MAPDVPDTTDSIRGSAGMPAALLQAPEQHEIAASTQPKVSPGDGCVPPDVRAPQDVPVLRQPVELKLALLDHLRLADWASLDLTCHPFHQLVAPQLAPRRVTHFAAAVRTSAEVEAVIGTGQTGETGTLLSLPERHQAEPLVALGYAICEMSPPEREASIPLWVTAVSRLTLSRRPSPTDVRRIGEAARLYRPSMVADNQGELRRIGTQLRQERYAEAEIQAALDTLGLWMQAFEALHLPSMAAPLLGLAVAGWGATLGPELAARAILASRIGSVLHAPDPSVSTREALAGSVRQALAARSHLDRVTQLDVEAPATQRALEILIGHIQAARNPLNAAAWLQLGRVALVMLALWLTGGS